MRPRTSGHLGDYRCPACGHARPPLDVAARSIELAGLDSASFDLVAPEGTRRVELALPGLYNVYNAVAAAALARALGASLDEIAAGLGRFSAAFGRFERIAVGDKGVLLLLIKNPAGANEAVRTLVDGGAPRRRRRRVERRNRRRPRRVVDLGRRLRAAARRSRARRRERRPRRRARAPLRLRRSRRVARSRSSPSLERALDRGLALTPAGGELVVLPTYTAMLGAPADRLRTRLHEALLGADGMSTIRVGHLYPDYLNIYADRGNIAVLTRRAALRGHELAVSALGMDDRDRARRARSLLRGRRPGPRAAARRARTSRRRPSRSRRPCSKAARRCSRSAAATSCSAAATAASTAKTCRVSGCCRSRPWPATDG